MSKTFSFTDKIESVSIPTFPKSEGISKDQFYPLGLSPTINNSDPHIFPSSCADECKVFNTKISSPNEKYSITFTQATEEYTNDTVLKEESTLNTFDFKYLIPFRKICQPEDIEKSKYQALRQIRSLQSSVNKLAKSAEKSNISFTKDEFTQDLRKRINEKLAMLEERKKKKNDVSFDNLCCLF